MKTLFFLLLFSVLLSCAETNKPLANKLEMNASNFVFDVEFIDNRMPSPTPSKNKAYCIISVSPKSGVFENNWRIRRFKVNTLNYFTFDDNKFKGKGKDLYTNSVREIALGKNHKVWMELENENGTLIELTNDNPKVSIVH